MTDLRNLLALAAVRLNAAIREARAAGLDVYVAVDKTTEAPGTPDERDTPVVNIWTRPAPRGPLDRITADKVQT